jgi:hypothetical protein
MPPPREDDAGKEEEGAEEGFTETVLAEASGGDPLLRSGPESGTNLSDEGTSLRRSRSRGEHQGEHGGEEPTHPEPPQARRPVFVRSKAIGFAAAVFNGIWGGSVMAPLKVTTRL